MIPKLPTDPFDSTRYIGAVTAIGPDTVKINLPYASTVSSKSYAGYSILGGQVGEFVFIECEDYATLGRITDVKLPDGERLNVEPVLGATPLANPIGFVQLLTTLDLASGRVISGISQHPRIGQHVFSAHPLLVKYIIEKSTTDSAHKLELATIPQETNTRVDVDPAHLFGRHCAILGATGGGKSWTVAKIAQEIAKIKGKAILLDPTGEFHTLSSSTRHIFLGGEKIDATDTRLFVGFPYWDLTELDLFAIFQPSSGAQAPKFREAFRSLKLAYLMTETGQQPKVYTKSGSKRADYNQAVIKHNEALEAANAKYIMKHLPKQIMEECVFESGGTSREPDHTIWGGYSDQMKGYCETLVAKIYSIIRSKALACLFEPEKFESLTAQIEDFLNSDASILRISMEYLPFEHNARELLTNALGRFLINKARDGRFVTLPTVIILDEAHQFLNKHLGEENNKIRLDAFGLIAKEGRKYGLTAVLATQRPRDIPEDVLSQMGMFIVHRLTNERDREIVEKACGNLDGSAAAFLPTLGQGEAILVGVDFPMPTPVKIIAPMNPPKSAGPNYKAYWK